jgi:hypothetical protein
MFGSEAITPCSIPSISAHASATSEGMTPPFESHSRLSAMAGWVRCQAYRWSIISVRIDRECPLSL